MKKLICLLLAVLFVCAFALTGCNSSTTEEPDVEATDAPAAEAVDEAGALAVVLEDLCVPETALENLTTELVDGNYVLSFQWSGFDYKYTVNAETGELVEIFFDGDVIFPK